MRPTTYPAKNCTIPMRFVDTNVLIYAASPSPQETEKHRRAQDLLNRDDLALSIQVLGEFYYQVTRPNRTEPLTHAQALEFLDSISGFQVQPMTVEIFTQAVEISQRFQLSYWDGAILASRPRDGMRRRVLRRHEPSTRLRRPADHKPIYLIPTQTPSLSNDNSKPL